MCTGERQGVRGHEPLKDWFNGLRAMPDCYCIKMNTDFKQPLLLLIRSPPQHRDGWTAILLIMFPTADDYFDFERLIEHCQSITDLGVKDRADAGELFRFLRSEFGVNFLRNASTERHPLVPLIVNLAPWTRLDRKS